MSFSCRNYDFDHENCAKLKTECIPGRPGCVLVGKVKFSEEITGACRSWKKTTNRQRQRSRKNK